MMKRLLRPSVMVMVLSLTLASGWRTDSPASAGGDAALSKRTPYRPIDQGYFLSLGADTIIIPADITIDGVPTRAGSIRAGLTENPNSIMKAEFYMRDGFNDLCACYEFHWVQIIVADDCPAAVACSIPNMPVVDAPAYGWDYMYVDQDGSGCVEADERYPNGIPDEGWDEDIEENEPWYSPAGEEAATFAECDSYPIYDEPDFCDDPADGETKFQTYLVLREKSTSAFCILAGFSWSIKDVADGNQGPTELEIGEDDRTAVEQGLANGSIPGWTVSTDCEVNNPSAVECVRWGTIKAKYR
jgi:hypothetical protein